MIGLGQARPPGGSSIEMLKGFSAQREAAERELGDRGFRLPLQQRAQWQRASGAVDSILVVARDAQGSPLQAVSAGVTISRALLAHRLYRIERFTPSSSEADADVLAALTSGVRRDARSLRAVVEVFEPDPEARQRLSHVLSKIGFRRSAQPRAYTHTLSLNLTRTEDEIFAGIHATGRRHVRAAAKRGLELRAIVDASHAPRLGFLVDEAFKRTKGAAAALPWAGIIELSVAHPNLSRVVGLFDGASTGPASLVAFAWGCCHGTYASYEAGGSVRREDLGNTPLGYAPLWDLIAWAREHTSASWFDLGGVSSGGTGDSRQGISDFKRYFSEQVVDVGEEWSFEPHLARATLARGVASAARWFSDVAASKSSQSPIPSLGAERAAQPKEQRV